MNDDQITKIEEQLIRDEGLRLKPYFDTVGKLTIGIGRNLDDKGISEEEAKTLLKNDIKECEVQVLNALSWAFTMNLPRYAVLLNMCFNLGINGLLQFKNALAAMESEQWEKAATEMLDSKWAAQVGDRAVRLSKQMTTGEWQ